ncbi:ceramide synthase 4-like isoform X2 [Bolinopsis microptera]|uniref:ceramide synthase 4-like isoform X2 n=1 Tax=Bolinopsis microptera TaxID=2820187 RepID=UPI00307A0323
MEEVIFDFTRIFRDPWDTHWWLGKHYHEEHGNEWPGKEDPGPGLKNPSPKDALLVVLAMALLLAFLKGFFEKYIASPVASALGIKQCRKRAYEHVPVLENHLKSNKYNTPDEKTMQSLSSEAGMTLRQVQVWVRRRQQAVLSTRHTKFVESFWRFVFYGCTFTYGLSSLWNENYLWDTKYCWIGYPDKIWAMKDNIYWYYMIEMGYYTACLVIQFTEVKRKDFNQMFLHHIATVLLISLSYVTGRTRIGALTMLIHDFSDISLEACKMAKYTKRIEAANVLFATFGISFFVSRIIYYPYSILHSVVFETPSALDPTLTILIIFLHVLYFLHIFWFSLIVRVVMTFAKNEQPEGDLRSEEEAPSSSEEERKEKKVE